MHGLLITLENKAIVLNPGSKLESSWELTQSQCPEHILRDCDLIGRGGACQQYLKSPQRILCNWGQETLFPGFMTHDWIGTPPALSLYISPHAKHPKLFSRQEMRQQT